MASTQIRTGRSRVGDNIRTAWRSFRRWRRSRPFWAGLFTLLGGVEIMVAPLAPLPILLLAGIAGISGLLMGALMVVMGLSMWFAPQYKVFAGIATLLFALASFVTSNFGGFLIGMLFGIVGGSMSVAWVRVPPPRPPAAEPADGPAETPDGPDGPDGPGGGAAEPTSEAAAEPAAEPTSDDAAEDTSSARPDPTGDPTAGGTPGEDAPPRDGGGTRVPLIALVLAAVCTALAAGPAAPRPAVAAEVPVVNAVVPEMRAQTITMSGLTFDGVTVLSTAEGPLRSLKFSMSAVVMQDYTLEAPGGDHAAALGFRIGTLTLRSNVTFYTTRMSGLLGGLVPVVFTPDLPPPLVTPETRFTGFASEQVFVVSDHLDAKGLSVGAART